MTTTNTSKTKTTTDIAGIRVINIASESVEKCANWTVTFISDMGVVVISTDYLGRKIARVLKSLDAFLAKRMNDSGTHCIVIDTAAFSALGL